VDISLPWKRCQQNLTEITACALAPPTTGGQFRSQVVHVYAVLLLLCDIFRAKEWQDTLFGENQSGMLSKLRELISAQTGKL
jgi:hypothetical protein